MIVSTWQFLQGKFVQQHELGCIARINLAYYEAFAGFGELPSVVPVE
jgi:hypothetical protein